MEETAQKQPLMIEALTNLMQTQNNIFTDTLNQQRALINKLQADLDKASKDHKRKVEEVRNQGLKNFILLDKKLD